MNSKLKVRLVISTRSFHLSTRVSSMEIYGFVVVVWKFVNKTTIQLIRSIIFTSPHSRLIIAMDEASFTPRDF